MSTSRIKLVAVVAGLVLAMGALPASGAWAFFTAAVAANKVLKNSDFNVKDQFGFAVSISADTALVGAHDNDFPATDAGSAYIFERTVGGTGNWGQVRRLVAGDAANGDQLGVAVALDTDTAVVGAFADGGGDTGSAYVFERNQGGANNWGQLKKLTVNGLSTNAFFGRSVAVDGDTIVVAAYANVVGGSSNAGSVYVFGRHQGGAAPWGLVRQLNAPSPAVNGQFGWDVSVSGATLIVAELGPGRVHFFDRNQGGANNWGLVRTVVGSGLFAWSAEIDGDTAVVGAITQPIAGGSATLSGAAFILQRNQGGANTWGTVKKLVASDGQHNDQFGISVDIDGDIVVVGAFAEDAKGVDSGSAYVFGRNQGGAGIWGEVNKLVGSDSTAQHWFGFASATDGARAIVGAPYNNGCGNPCAANRTSGRAYIFDLGPPPPPPNVPNAPTGLAATTVASGQNDVTWIDNSSDESAFWLYHMEQVAGSAWDLIAQLPANTVTYSDTGLSVGSAYCYRVTARNSGGPSSFSNIGCTTVVGGGSTPSDPSNLSASPVSDRRIELSWADNSAGETGFRVFVEEHAAGGRWIFVADVAANSTAFSHTGLTSGTGYCYRVLARDGALSSGYSNISCATTAGFATLPAVSGLSATGYCRRVVGWNRALSSSYSYISCSTKQ